MTRQQFIINKYNQNLLVDIQNEIDKVEKILVIIQNKIDEQLKNCERNTKFPYLFIYFVFPFLLNDINKFENFKEKLEKHQTSLRELQLEIFAKSEFYDRKNQASFVLMLDEIYMIQRDIGIYQT